MVYFTSDLHFGHKGILTMQNRPFSSVEEMNRVLLDNYNSVVHKKDTVYILGDIAHHMKLDAVNDLIREMNGIKYLIRGNHDKRYDPQLFREITDFRTASLNGQYVAMMHYPMLSWPKSRKGSLQLHGHIHEDKSYNLKNKAEHILRYDVGIDANDFFPVSIEQILDFFEIESHR